MCVGVCVSVFFVVVVYAHCVLFSNFSMSVLVLYLSGSILYLSNLCSFVFLSLHNIV